MFFKLQFTGCTRSTCWSGSCKCTVNISLQGRHLLVQNEEHVNIWWVITVIIQFWIFWHVIKFCIVMNFVSV